MVRGKLAALALIWAASAQAVPPLPEADEQVHRGVASCASSVCHGKVNPDPDATVWLSEARVWQRRDDHSKAYRRLQDDQSKAIARKLGLASAAGADICLDCHADNVPSEYRGAKFQISDGVSCEACHGGSEQWIKSHAESGTSHADNLAKGMYPTEDPLARAELCLSCHLGTADKFATHQIMGAGHPRLTFELELWTVRQPAHYDVDADYIERKPYTDSARMWLIGMAINARESAALLQTSLFQRPGLVPELSFFQCFDCHHPTNQLRWEPEGVPPLPPGAVRLNDGPLLILIDTLEVLAPDSARSLAADLWALHEASQVSRDEVAANAAQLEGKLNDIAALMADIALGPAEFQALRTRLLTQAQRGAYRHFTAAEQAFLAVENLSILLKDDQEISASLDGLFEAVENENDFEPQLFAARAAKVRAAL